MFRGIRKLLKLSPLGGSAAPGARHALPRRTIARASVISVAMSSLLLVPLAPANAAACTSPSTTTETVSGVSYTLVAFKTTETCTWTAPTGVSQLTNVLVVAGGGGGGAHVGAGGGAGGLLQLTDQAVSGPLTISVGAGGLGAETANGTDVNGGVREASNGDNSAITIGATTTTGIGGGHGAFWWNGSGTSGVAGDGGSGGGGGGGESQGVLA